MLNLVTPEYHVILQREYRARTAAVALFLLAGVMVIGIGFLFPSYILSRTARLTAQKEIAVVESGLSNAETSPQAVIEQANKKLVLLSGDTSSSMTELLALVISYKPSGLLLTSFFYTAESTDKGSLQISGVAQSRDDLVVLRRSLERQSRFTNVALPVSNLAKNQDIPFTVSLSVTF